MLVAIGRRDGGFRQLSEDQGAGIPRGDFHFGPQCYSRHPIHHGLGLDRRANARDGGLGEGN
eukprot:3940841-Rhodomonas_salina.1